MRNMSQIRYIIVLVAATVFYAFIAVLYKIGLTDSILFAGLLWLLPLSIRFGEGMLRKAQDAVQKGVKENKERLRIFNGKEKFTNLLIGMEYPQDLTEIMDVIKKSGLFRVNIYSLDGMLVSDYPVSAWLKQEENNRKVYFTPISSLKAGLTNASLQLLYNVLVVKDDELEKEYNKTSRLKNYSPGSRKSRLKLKKKNLEEYD